MKDDPSFAVHVDTGVQPFNLPLEIGDELGITKQATHKRFARIERGVTWVFEAFTPEAANAVLEVTETARRLVDDTLRSEHLLVGALVAGSGHWSVERCEAAGVTADAALGKLRDGLGPDAARDLAALGIDLGVVEAQVEASFGPGALRGAGRQWPRIPFPPGHEPDRPQGPSGRA